MIETTSREAMGVVSEYVPAGTELEARVAALWSRKLGVAPVGLADDFFELGGDSLLAADVLMDIYTELGLEVDAAVLFLKPTVRELVGAMLAERAAADGDPAPPLDPARIHRPDGDPGP